MSYPNFMIVGAAKAGTTSLAYYLAQHPDIFMSAKKETRFFSQEYEKGIDFYRNNYFSDVFSEKMAGEADVTYFMRPFVARKIKAELADIKIIIILRNPVERAYSGYLMARRGARKEKRPFLEVLRENKRQLEEYYKLVKNTLSEKEAEEKYQLISWKSELLQCGHYYENITRFISCFGESNVKILHFKQLVDDAPAVCEEVFRFFNVDPCQRIDYTIKNQYRSKNRFYLNKIIPSWIKRKSVKALVSKIKIARPQQQPPVKPVINAEEKKWLIDYYRQPNKQLADYLKCDLSSWSL